MRNIKRRANAGVSSAKVMAFIHAEIAAQRPFPSATAIAAHMGWQHKSSAAQCLRKLGGDGLLKLVNTGKTSRVRHAADWALRESPTASARSHSPREVA